MSSAPNFGFALAARKTDAAAAKELSLSHVRILMDAAEPVREANVRAFLARFQPAGITPGVYTPGYGLAEHGAWFGPSRSTCASIRCNLKGGFDPQGITSVSSCRCCCATLRWADGERGLPSDFRVGQAQDHCGPERAYCAGAGESGSGGGQQGTRERVELVVRIDDVGR